MFIGGSPMGTAGGVKTVTVAVLLLYAYSYIRSRRDAVVFRRGITWELAQKAVAILIASLLLSLCATIALAAAERLSLTDAMFEVFSGIHPEELKCQQDHLDRKRDRPVSCACLW